MNAEVKPGYLCQKGYKQTEVGVIPEEWDVLHLSEAIRGNDLVCFFRSLRHIFGG